MAPGILSRCGDNLEDMEISQRIRLYTTTSCSDCRRAKRFLDAWRVPYDEINIEDTPGAAEFVVKANQGRRSVPTFEVAGRVFYCSPFDPETLARELNIPAAY
jgi:glutaredoxin